MALVKILVLVENSIFCQLMQQKWYEYKNIEDEWKIGRQCDGTFKIYDTANTTERNAIQFWAAKSQWIIGMTFENNKRKATSTKQIMDQSTNKIIVSQTIKANLVAYNSFKRKYFFQNAHNLNFDIFIKMWSESAR